jgi:hypothetical protein
VASTAPSTTSVSQSVISTPLSLILGPTVSLLSPGLLPALSLAKPVLLATAGAGAGTAGVAVGTLVWRADPLAVVDDKAWSRSRLELLKKGDCSAIGLMLHSKFKEAFMVGRKALTKGPCYAKDVSKFSIYDGNVIFKLQLGVFNVWS